MAKKFIEWIFDDFIPDMFEMFYQAAKHATYLLIALITCPIWILPFAYWYFAKWKGEAEDGNRNEWLDKTS